MGLGPSAIKLLTETIVAHQLQGRILVIGKQDVWGTEPQIRRWLKESGLTPKPGQPRLSLKPEMSALGYIQDTSLFEWMGFAKVTTLDNSDYEGADAIWDLNEPVTADFTARTGQFDVIVDAGCTEHIFNVPQVLRNFSELLVVGGVLIHILPSSNYVDHGFYMFSPTLFHDYYTVNQWTILTHYFFQCAAPANKKWKVYYYQPGTFGNLSFTGLPQGLYGLFVVVRKTSQSTHNAHVQQGAYLRQWSEKSPAPMASGKWHAQLAQLALRLPRLYALYLRIMQIGSLRRHLRHYKTL